MRTGIIKLEETSLRYIGDIENCTIASYVAS